MHEPKSVLPLEADDFSYRWRWCATLARNSLTVPAAELRRCVVDEVERPSTADHTLQLPKFANIAAR